jgi:hypothetical protein
VASSSTAIGSQATQDERLSQSRPRDPKVEVPDLLISNNATGWVSAVNSNAAVFPNGDSDMGRWNLGCGVGGEESSTMPNQRWGLRLVDQLFGAQNANIYTLRRAFRCFGIFY